MARACGSTTSSTLPSRIAWAARRPISCKGTVTVVSPTKCAGRVSSMPVTETSPGTSTPASRRRTSRPIAASSLAATTAWGSVSRASSTSAAAIPSSYAKPPGMLSVPPARDVARAALRARVQARWALDEGDPIVAEAADVGRDVVGGGLVVEQDRGRVEVALREGDDGGAAVAGVGDGVGDGVRARVSLPAAAGEDDPRGVVVAQLVEMAELRLAAELGAAHHRQVAEVRGHGLDPARDLGEVGIDDVADDHADDARAARDERAGERGWRVPELFGGLEDAIARSLGDRMGGTIQDARARGDRDARVSADVAERRHGGKRYGGERSWNMTS